MTYADDPKVSAIIGDGNVSLLFAGTRKLYGGPCFDATTIMQGLKIIFDVFLQGTSRKIGNVVRY